MRASKLRAARYTFWIGSTNAHSVRLSFHRLRNGSAGRCFNRSLTPDTGSYLLASGSEEIVPAISGVIPLAVGQSSCHRHQNGKRGNGRFAAQHHNIDEVLDCFSGWMILLEGHDVLLRARFLL